MQQLCTLFLLRRAAGTSEQSPPAATLVAPADPPADSGTSATDDSNQNPNVVYNQSQRSSSSGSGSQTDTVGYMWVPRGESSGYLLSLSYCIALLWIFGAR